uniref:Uncharacterized protein n=1 Tax=Caenorhabditis japonica TaxID=281687 RepID=A0A8R1E5F8_CAEJA
MEVVISTNLAGHIRKTTLSKADLHHILREGITINDDSLEEEVEPDMIIGDDYLPEFLKGNMLKLPSGVYLMGTKVGHTTWGKPSTRTPTDSRDSALLDKDHLMFTAIPEEDKDSGRQAEELQQLDTQIKSEFKHSGPLAEEISEDNKETMARFEDTIERREDGYQC